jgi:predicted metal-dependent peptidase
MFGGERQWLPPNRRYVWKNLYLPRRAKKQSIEIVLAIDTSGSTTEDLPDFLAELRGMTSAFGEYKLIIIQCDTRIRSVKEYSNDDPLPEKLQFYGFGGTSLIPPFNYVKGKTPPTVFIYLTDGFGDAPAKAPDYPVIWCLTKEGKKPAKWGLEVKIKG